MAKLEDIYRKLEEEKNQRIENERLQAQELWEQSEKMRQYYITENNMYNYVRAPFGNSGGHNNKCTNSYVDDDYICDYLY